jgi:hypothetical protein
MAGVDGYLELLRKNPDRPVAHASTWLNGERWEGFDASVDVSKQMMIVRQGTPQWEAWKKHREARGSRFMPESLTVLTDWPPDD